MVDLEGIPSTLRDLSSVVTIRTASAARTTGTCLSFPIDPIGATLDKCAYHTAKVLYGSPVVTVLANRVYSYDSVHSRLSCGPLSFYPRK